MNIIFILNIFQPSSILACFCTWLVTSLDSCISTDLKLELNSALEHHIWSQQQVESLLEEAVSTGHVTTLARGFTLFLPVSKQNVVIVLCLWIIIFHEHLVSVQLVQNFPAVIEHEDDDSDSLLGIS
jgi:hypothetical protein